MTQPQGLFGLPNLHDLLPPVVADAIRDVAGSIIDGSGPAPGSPQPEGEKPIPTADEHQLNGAIKAIDTVLSAIGVIMKFKALIPDEHVGYLTGLESALKTIRGWLD